MSTLIPGGGPPAGAANSSARQGMRVVFDTGMGATAGGLIIKNAVTGTSIMRKLAPNLAPGACLKTLQRAALEAGLQIQMDGDALQFGVGVRTDFTAKLHFFEIRRYPFHGKPPFVESENHTAVRQPNSR